MRVIYRELVTPDGTTLISNHRHDYVTYTDKNGKQYMLDGGCNSGYYRCSANGDENIIEITDDNPFEVIREYIRWGRNYDKDMNLLPKTEWIPLKDLDQEHLETLCLYEKAEDFYRVNFIKEKLYRAEQEY